MVLTDRVAVVTGGGRGIGRGICLALARLGADVVINYAGNNASAEETAQACIDLGVRAVTVAGDVSRAEDSERIIQTAVEQFGRIDILVNNAGITRDGLLMKMTEEDFDRVVDTNMKGAFLCMKHASRIMMKQRFGRIINISSVIGLHGNAGQVNYAASKAGIIGMTKSLARELASRNITVNAVAPGFIATEMTDVLPDAAKDAMLSAIPVRRAGTPEDIAHAVAFLAAPETSYITGQVLCVDGGMFI